MTEIDTIRTIDDIFLQMAEAAGGDVALDEAVEYLWTALERGALRLVVDGDRLRIEPFAGTQDERLLVAEQNWPLVAARKRVICGLYEDEAKPRRRTDEQNGSGAGRP